MSGETTLTYATGLSGEPGVHIDDRDSLIRWLQWNDRNGSYSDKDAEAEGFPSLTLEQARELYLDQSGRSAD